MIRPPGWDGVAFSEATDGDALSDLGARLALSESIAVPAGWATVRQVHGAEVIRVDAPGEAGEADALWTTERGLAVAVFTADCFPVVVQADGAVGVAHAGWRGTAAGVVPALLGSMSASGHQARRAAVGPGIGPCCFEVGDDVAQIFERHESRTTWSTSSVDLPGALTEQVGGLPVWSHGGCTYHDEGWFSHRRDRATERMVALGWIP